MWVSIDVWTTFAREPDEPPLIKNTKSSTRNTGGANQRTQDPEKLKRPTDCSSSSVPLFPNLRFRIPRKKYRAAMFLTSGLAKLVSTLSMYELSRYGIMTTVPSLKGLGMLRYTFQKYLVQG